MLRKLWDYFLLFVCAIIRRLSTAVENRTYRTNIIFNTVWEDSRLDREALKINEDDTILTISSAGCNALSLLLDNPRHIYLVDINPCQNALVELKLAAIKNLEYDAFWKMFGEGTLPGFSKKYYPKLRSDLSPEAQKFWDSKAFYFDGTGLKRSFYWRGSCGTISYIFSWYIHCVPGLNKAMKNLLEAKTLEEQQSIYFKDINNKLWSRLILNLLKTELYLSWTGVPGPQQKLLINAIGSSQMIGNWIRDQIEYICTQLPIQDNHYWRIYFDGKYSKSCCPDYLKEENFEQLKASVGKISIYTDTVTEFLQKNPNTKISTYILLDHMDWMAEKPELLAQEWNVLLKNATKDPKFLWRSAAKDAEFVLNTNVTYEGEQRELRDVLEMDVDTATRLHPLDRVHTYTSLHIATLKAN